MNITGLLFTWRPAKIDDIRGARSSDGNVHPAILVEISNREAIARPFTVAELHWHEVARQAIVKVNGRRSFDVPDDDIDVSVVKSPTASAYATTLLPVSGPFPGGA